MATCPRCKLLAADKPPTKRGSREGYFFFAGGAATVMLLTVDFAPADFARPATEFLLPSFFAVPVKVATPPETLRKGSAFSFDEAAGF